MVDKDLAAVVLAAAVDAKLLLLLTDVDAVYDGFGTPTARRLERLSTKEARRLVDAGEALAGRAVTRP